MWKSNQIRILPNPVAGLIDQNSLVTASGEAKEKAKHKLNIMLL